MAGEWIPFLKTLPKSQEVLYISEATGMSRREVVCLLMEFWSWCDDQIVSPEEKDADGFLPGLTVRSLSAFDADMNETFVRSLSAVKWILVRDDGIVIPHFSRWMGQSARRRLQESLRKRKSRARSGTKCGQVSASDQGQVSASDADKKRPTKQNKTVIETPPSPSSEGEKSVKEITTPESQIQRPVVISDYPHLAPIAKKLSDQYLREVSAHHGPGKGAQAILTLLVQGHSEADLRQALTNFATWFKRTGKERQYAPSVPNFFAPGYWSEFLAGVPPTGAEQQNQYLPDNPPAARDPNKKLATKPWRERAAELRGKPQDATEGVQTATGSPRDLGSLPGAKFEGRNGVHE